MGWYRNECYVSFVTVKPPWSATAAQTLIQKGSFAMTFVPKFLPALALVVALSPLAAQAQSAPQQTQGDDQIVVLTIPQQAQSDGQMVVFDGIDANSFPNSFGG
jgi:hypothetical protein